MVAPESGSQRVIDEIIDKHLKLQDVERAVEKVTRNGIGVGMSFVMGLAKEKRRKRCWS